MQARRNPHKIPKLPSHLLLFFHISIRAAAAANVSAAVACSPRGADVSVSVDEDEEEAKCFFNRPSSSSSSCFFLFLFLSESSLHKHSGHNSLPRRLGLLLCWSIQERASCIKSRDFSAKYYGPFWAQYLYVHCVS